MANGILKRLGGMFAAEQVETSHLPAINIQKEEKAVRTKKVNPRSYERNRGKNGSKAMSYYIPDYVLKALSLKAARDGISKSDLVVEGLKHILSAELKELREKGEI